MAASKRVYTDADAKVIVKKGQEYYAEAVDRIIEATNGVAPQRLRYGFDISLMGPKQFLQARPTQEKAFINITKENFPIDQEKLYFSLYPEQENNRILVPLDAKSKSFEAFQPKHVEAAIAGALETLLWHRARIEKETGKTLPRQTLVFHGVNIGSNHAAVYACNTDGEILLINSLDGYTSWDDAAVKGFGKAFAEAGLSSSIQPKVFELTPRYAQQLQQAKDSNMCGAVVATMACAISATNSIKTQLPTLATHMAKVLQNEEAVRVEHADIIENESTGRQGIAIQYQKTAAELHNPNVAAPQPVAAESSTAIPAFVPPASQPSASSSAPAYVKTALETLHDDAIAQLETIKAQVSANPQASKQKFEELMKANGTFSQIAADGANFFAQAQSSSSQGIINVAEQRLAIRKLVGGIVSELDTQKAALNDGQERELHRLGLLTAMPNREEALALSAAFKKVFEEFMIIAPDASNVMPFSPLYNASVEKYKKLSKEIFEPFMDSSADDGSKTTISATNQGTEKAIQAVSALFVDAMIKKIYIPLCEVIQKNYADNLQILQGSNLTPQQLAQEQQKLVDSFNRFIRDPLFIDMWKRSITIKDQLIANPYSDEETKKRIKEAYEQTKTFINNFNKQIKDLATKLNAASAGTAAPAATMPASASASASAASAPPPSSAAAASSAAPAPARASASTSVHAHDGKNYHHTTLPKNLSTELQTAFNALCGGQSNVQFREQRDGYDRLDKEIFKFSGVKGELSVQANKGVISINDNSDEMLQRLVDAVKVAAAANPGKTFQAKSTDKDIEAKLADMLKAAHIPLVDASVQATPAPAPSARI